jgi:hypothetical protein
MCEKFLVKKYSAPSDQAVCSNFSVNKKIQPETEITATNDYPQQSRKVKGEFS